jgi:arabinofuranan 3-O-arabinosyltransferase
MVSRPRTPVDLARAGETAALAVIAYLPFLLSSPGRVTADSKQALYVDPGGFLAGAPYLWDPGFGAGTVPHQHIGYLWPMGPWFWVFDQLGVPTWIAQRLWLGTLTLLALLGTRWLLRNLGAGRAVAVAGALAYALTPYQLAFTARASVLLLPWVGLPWIVELTRRALRHGGWRHPALIALVVVTVAGVNATSLLLVAAGPALVVAHHALAGRRAALTAVGAAARIGVLCTLVSAWWLAGLRVQGTHGMPVLQLTENLSEVAGWSLPNDVLRGLGNWFFAGQDRLGYSVDQASAYLDTQWGLLASLAVPVLALAAAALWSGRIRVVAVAMVFVGAVVAVGAWPYGNPSWFGRGFRWFADETSVGLAFRNSHRIAPVLVLGLVLVVSMAVASLASVRSRLAGAGVLAVAALVGLAPVAVHGFLSEHLDRPERLPEEWVAAADHLDGRGIDGIGNRSRVLELPGVPFAAHRWGNTVEPITAALLDRPHVAREVLPYGSPATANLLDAFERRLQEGTLEPTAVAPVARYLAAGDLLIRSDLQFERFRGPEPGQVWERLIDPSPPGLGETTTFGTPAVNEPIAHLAPVSAFHLRSWETQADDGLRPALPPAAVVAVEDAPGVIRVHNGTEPVVLAGDGDGLVDAAAAGLLDGNGLVLYEGSLDSDALGDALDRDAHLLVTDSNRRRIETWFYAIRDTRGPTERAGETLVEPTGYDTRLEPFADGGDEARTVTEHLGGEVASTLSGGAARPEDRAFAAFDDDLGTAWRVGGADPTGHRVSVTLPGPTALDHLVLVQPQDGPRDRHVEQVRLHLDDRDPVSIDLGPDSLEPSGQRVELDLDEPVQRIEIELTSVSEPGFDAALANAVGFARVELPGVELSETVVLPRSLLDRTGGRADTHGLDLVLTRLRYDAADRGRTAAERRLDRSVDLPSERGFGITGAARINPAAPDPELDELLDTSRVGQARASSRLAGDPHARASSAFDHDSQSAWTAAFGPQAGQWIELERSEGIRADDLVLEVANDEVHSLPVEIEVSLDGALVARHRLDDIPAPGILGSRHRVEIPTGPLDGTTLRITIVDIERRSTPPGDPAAMATLPVAIAAVHLGDEAPTDGSPAGAEPALVDTGCRDDLVVIDGVPVPVRVTGTVDRGDEALELALCGSEPTLGPGRHRLTTAPGHETGIDVDQLVLSSAPGGAATGPAVRGSTEPRSAITRIDWDRTRRQVEIDTDGEPFWLVLGESDSPGWEAQTESSDGVAAAIGDRVLVNGYANGWLISPAASGTVTIDLEWAPQQQVWFALAVSVFAVGLCLGLVAGTPRARLAPPPVVWASALSAGRRPAPAPTVVTAAVGGLVVAAVSRPWIGVLAALAVLAVAWWSEARLGLAVAAPAALVASYLIDEPAGGWLALALVVAATLGTELRSGWSGVRPPVTPADDPRERPPPAVQGS